MNQDWKIGLEQHQIDFIESRVNDGRIVPITVGGVTSPIWDINERPVIATKVGNTVIPQYISTGLGGKKTVATDLWYPIFGMGEDSGWFNKGRSSQINNLYDSSILKQMSKVYNEQLGYVPTGEMPYISGGDKTRMQAYARELNNLIGVGPALENNSTDTSLNSTATVNRVNARIQNILYKASGYTNIPYLDVVNRDINPLFTQEDSIRRGSGTPTVTPQSTQVPKPQIDIDSKYNGKSSEFTPGSKLLKTKYEKEIVSLYNEGLFTGLHDSAGVAQDLWRGESFTNIKAKLEARKQTIINSQNTSTHSAVQPNSRSGVNTKTTSGKNHTDTHEKVQENSFKNFFDNRRLVGFDTETTGLDVKNENLSKRSRIWQTGLAIDGASGVEEHTSPFFTSNVDGSLSPAARVNTIFAEDMMKHSNGRFSLKAAENGNFNTFLKLYDENKLATLDNSIVNTLGAINSSDVLVLQNMNFENTILKSSLDQGILSPDVYQDIASRMHTVEMNADGTVKTLLQRPAAVQQFMRKADMLYHSEYLNSFNEESFNQYRQNLNSAIGAYEELITSPNKTGTIAVELQDVTKAFLANTADRGLIDKRTSTLGLNVEFLSQAILGKGEQHTALQDSQDTIDLFKKIWSMNKEMQSGAELSETTLQTIENIKSRQPEEINKRFFSTVRSVLDDFKTRKYTNLSGKYSWYNPQLNLQEKTADGFVNETLEKISIGGRQSENRLNVALDNVLDRYGQYNDNIQGINRKEYVNSLVEQFNNGANYSELHTKVENDLFNFNPPEPIGPQQINILNETKSNISDPSFLSEKTKFFGKEMTNKTKFGIIGGIGAGLATMAFTSRPHPNYEQGHVSEQFYDEPYLGSAFIDFKERNKHYMM